MWLKKDGQDRQRQIRSDFYSSFEPLSLESKNKNYLDSIDPSF